MGATRFEKSIDYRPHVRERLYRGPLAARAPSTGASSALLTALLAGGVRRAGVLRDAATCGSAVVLALLSIVPVSDVALNVVNRLAAWLWPARTLPKIDHRQPVASGAPHDGRLHRAAHLAAGRPARHRQHGDRLPREHRPQRAVSRFSPTSRARPSSGLPADAAVIEAARHGIAVLNDAYGPPGERPFSLFVRGRTWSEHDEIWMGWERKRGALTEFCSLLRGATDTSFEVVDADPAESPRKSRSSSRSTPTPCCRATVRASSSPRSRTRSTARSSIRPRARCGAATGSCSRGSRCRSRAPNDSLFAWLYSGVTGVDPYAGAVSDTYQDVFGEGSFTGKGIFEVDIFNAVLDDRFPREHAAQPRPARGLATCGPHSPATSRCSTTSPRATSRTARACTAGCAATGRRCRGCSRASQRPTGREKNPLSALHRWKIIDNLRRSLLPAR